MVTYLAPSGGGCRCIISGPTLEMGSAVAQGMKVKKRGNINRAARICMAGIMCFFFISATHNLPRILVLLWRERYSAACAGWAARRPPQFLSADESRDKTVRYDAPLTSVPYNTAFDTLSI